jgi:hypothetical protein
MKVAKIQNFKETLPYIRSYNYNGTDIYSIYRNHRITRDYEVHSKSYIGKEYDLEDRNNKKWIYKCIFIGSKQYSSAIELYQFKDSDGNVHEVKNNDSRWNVYFKKFEIRDDRTDLLTMNKINNDLHFEFYLYSNGVIDGLKQIK